jgi:hypothetical protein
VIEFSPPRVGKMARELVWLENFTVTAWGCSAYAWILPAATGLGKPQANVKVAFDSTNAGSFLARGNRRNGLNPREIFFLRALFSDFVERSDFKYQTCDAVRTLLMRNLLFDCPRAEHSLGQIIRLKSLQSHDLSDQSGTSVWSHSSLSLQAYSAI